MSDRVSRAAIYCESLADESKELFRMSKYFPYSFVSGLSCSAVVLERTGAQSSYHCNHTNEY